MTKVECERMENLKKKEEKNKPMVTGKMQGKKNKREEVE